jgi:hypothetical protein
MIYTTTKGGSFDTDKDLSAPERHILQKLFIWKDLASGVAEFRARKQEALLKGWGDSGPIEEGPAMRSIAADLEEQVARRIQARQESTR